MPAPAVPREPLTRDRILRAAMTVADAGGITALTMRSLAAELGVRPMSLYHYVATKDEVLDGVVDLVFSEIETPRTGGEWRAEIARRAHSARTVLARHGWAIGLLESRTTPGRATLAHHDAVLAVLLEAGFSLPMVAHAYALLDSYVYGFALQEAGLPFDGPDGVGDIAEPIMASFASDELPHFTRMATDHYLLPGYDFGDEFSWGLELILDGLAATLARERSA